MRQVITSILLEFDQKNIFFVGSALSLRFNNLGLVLVWPNYVYMDVMQSNTISDIRYGNIEVGFFFYGCDAI